MDNEVSGQVKNLGHSKLELKIFFVFMFHAPFLVPRGPSALKFIFSSVIQLTPPAIPNTHTSGYPTQFCSISTLLWDLKNLCYLCRKTLFLSTSDNPQICICHTTFSDKIGYLKAPGSPWGIDGSGEINYRPPLLANFNGQL